MKLEMNTGKISAVTWREQMKTPFIWRKFKRKIGRIILHQFREERKIDEISSQKELVKDKEFCFEME